MDIIFVCSINSVYTSVPEQAVVFSSQLSIRVQSEKYHRTKMDLQDVWEINVFNKKKMQTFTMYIKKKICSNSLLDDQKLEIFKRKPELLNFGEINFYWIGEF